MKGSLSQCSVGSWELTIDLGRQAAYHDAGRVGHTGMTLRSLRDNHASVALQAEQYIVVVSKSLENSNVSMTLYSYAYSLPA